VAALRLGLLLRHVGADDATVWVKTDAPFGVSRWGERLGTLLTRAARVAPHALRWEQVGGGPWFDNQVATLELEGRRAIMRLEKAVGAASAPPQLECVMEERLA
jgi:hypothetical protein